MTLTIKNPTDSNSPGKPGATSQNSENNSGQNPRSNPVCLELNVTIRSLPNETGGLSQPIREDGRTVIVFDNGAVLRSENKLPIGQTVILSNSKGRDVVCRVVGGRNLPSVKGYVEVEFIEPVKDFWGIHQDAESVSVAAPPAPMLSTREPAVPPPPPIPPQVATPLEAPAKPASVPLGSGPSFEDIPGLLSSPVSTATRESKTQSARLGPERLPKDNSDYNLSGVAQSTSVGNWRPPDAELPTEKRAIAAMRDALSTSSPTSTLAPSREFMSKGLMAYDKTDPSSSASSGRMPLILGVGALVLVAVGAGVFFMHRTAVPDSVAKSSEVSQSSAPEPAAAKSASQPVPAPREESAQAATQNQNKTQAQPSAVDQAQPVAAIAPVPAVVKSAETADSRTDPGNVRSQAENAVVTKQPNPPSSRRPAIPNLKMSSPSAPIKNASNLGDASAPMTEIASTEAVGGTPAELLTSAGRTSNPPAPPPSAMAPAPVVAAKTVRDPKLISSTRPVYPATAKQTGVQGTVTVSAYVDENGKVAGAWALNGPMLLRQAAVDSVKQWKYSPGLTDGKPAPTKITVGVEFRLN
jgi:protein TonB